MSGCRVYFSESMKSYSVCSLLLLIITASGCSAQRNKPMFSPAQDGFIKVGDHPADLVTADVNKDGKLDLITANLESKDITVLLGDGVGGFRQTSGSPFKVKNPAHHIVAGDLNKDENLDLTLTFHDSYEIMILVGDGKGNFGELKTVVEAVQAEKAHNHGLALADLNGDKNLDFITSNTGVNSVSVLLGNGKLNFKHSEGSPFRVGKWPYPLVIADVNRDSYPDILTPNFGGASTSVLFGDGKGNYSSNKESIIKVASTPYFLTAGDLNNDQKPDLVTSHNDINTITILLGDGRGGFKPASFSPLDVETRVWKIALADLNSDNNNDIILAAQIDNSVIVLLGNGKGNFTPAPGSPYRVGDLPTGLAVGDVNLDGKLDIVTANARSDNVSVLLNQE